MKDCTAVPPQRASWTAKWKAEVATFYKVHLRWSEVLSRTELLQLETLVQDRCHKLGALMVGFGRIMKGDPAFAVYDSRDGWVHEDPYPDVVAISERENMAPAEDYAATMHSERYNSVNFRLVECYLFTHGCGRVRTARAST